MTTLLKIDPKRLGEPTRRLEMANVDPKALAA
jgi:hypothetical protein